MNIDKSKFKLGIWYEDVNGTVVSKGDPSACVYRHFNPLFVGSDFYSYGWQPTNRVVRMLCRSSLIYKFFNNRFIHKRVPRYMRTLKTDLSSEALQKLIVAMVNSGDYTLLESMYVVCHACERCTQVLLNEYLEDDIGYEELSDKWKEENTCCEFCSELGFHTRQKS